MVAATGLGALATPKCFETRGDAKRPITHGTVPTTQKDPTQDVRVPGLSLPFRMTEPVGKVNRKS